MCGDNSLIFINRCILSSLCDMCCSACNDHETTWESRSRRVQERITTLHGSGQATTQHHVDQVWWNACRLHRWTPQTPWQWNSVHSMFVLDHFQTLFYLSIA